MAVTHSIRYSYNDGSETINNTVTETSEAEINIDLSAPIANDTQVAFAAVRSRMKMFFMVSDQDLTVETNSSSAPDDTISLIANVPFIWHNTGPEANPFSADITALFLTNASAAAAAFKLRMVIDATP